MRTEFLLPLVIPSEAVSIGMWHSADTSVASSSHYCFPPLLTPPLSILPSLLLKNSFRGGISQKWYYLFFPHSSWIYWLQVIFSLMCKERVCLNGNTIWRKTNAFADRLLFVSFLVNYVSKDFLKYYLHITMNPILLLNKTKYLYFFIFSLCSNKVNYSLQKATGSG